MAVEKEDIVQYVQETPGNSNPAVLRSLLSQFEGSGEGATFKVEKEDDEKTYQSAYTGAEIDAAVAKADTVPAVTAADAGKALVVDEEGKIVAGEAGGFTEPTVELTAAESGVILTPLMPVFAAAGDTLTGYRGAISTGTNTIIKKVLPYCDGSYSRIKITFTGLDGIFYMKLTVLNNSYAHFDSDFNYYAPAGGSPCLFKLGIAIPLTDAGQLNVALYVQKVNLTT